VVVASVLLGGCLVVFASVLLGGCWVVASVLQGGCWVFGSCWCMFKWLQGRFYMDVITVNPVITTISKWPMQPLKHTAPTLKPPNNTNNPPTT